MRDSYSSTDSANLRTRVLRSGLALSAQRVLGVVVAAAGGIVLAKLLTPELFGVYGVMNFILGVGLLCGELGLGAALVQRRTDNLQVSLDTVFTVQFIVAGLLGMLLAWSAPVVVRWVGLPDDAAVPLQYLTALLLLAAVRVPATALLERGLQYFEIAVADFLDAVMFHLVAIAAALAGAGVWSFVLGALVARLASMAVLWRAALWRPAFRLRWPEIKPLLEIGMPFQGAAMLTMLREAVLPIVVAMWSGVAAVGFLNFATSIAFLPLSFVRIAGKVLFPALAQLQDDPARFANATGRALNRIAVMLVPCGLLLFVGADPIVRLIYGESWAPAVPAVRLLSVAAVLGGATGVMTYAFLALGQARLVWWLNVFWAVLLWGLSLALVPHMGFVGYAAASACVSATVVIPARLLRKFVPIQYLAQLQVPIIASVASAFLFDLFIHLWVRDVLSLVLGASVALTLYAGLVCAMSGSIWRADVRDEWQRALGARP